MHRRVFWIFIAVLLSAPLAFGTVERWSLVLMETLSVSAFLLLFVQSCRKYKTFYDVPGLVPLVCLGAYIFLQVVPLPAAFVKIISPATFALYNDTVGCIRPPRWIPLSINPGATLSEFFRFSAYLSFYVLTVQLLSQKEMLKKTVGILAVFAAIMAVLALVQQATAFQTGGGTSRKILWFRELAHGGSPFGPFVNRNHFAGWMGMVFPVVLSLFLFWQTPRVDRSFRERIVGFLIQDHTYIKILLGGIVVLSAASIFLSLSRGGIVSLCLASLFFVILMRGKPANYRTGGMISMLLIVLLCVGWFGWEPVFKRFYEIQDIHGEFTGQRPVIWRGALRIARDFPFTGSGYGTFISLYPKYGHTFEHLTVKHAENDYLEFLVEGGGVGICLVFWFFSVFLYRSVRTFRKRNDPYSIYLFSGALAGIVFALIHNFVDFNLHVGANALYFFFLLGLAVSAVNTRISYRKGGTYLRRHVISRPGLTGFLIIVAGLSMMIVNISGLIGEWNYTSIKDIRLTPSLSKTLLLELDRRSHRAILLDPLDARFRFAAANIDTFRSNDDLALKHYQAALRLDPTRGAYLQRLAAIFSGHAQLSAADRLFRAAVTFDPENPERNLRYAAWLLSRNRRQKARLYIRHGLDLDPGLTEETLTYLVLHGWTEKDMQAVLPRRVTAHLVFADYLLQVKKTDLAAEEYQKVLAIDPDNRNAKNRLKQIQGR